MRQSIFVLTLAALLATAALSQVATPDGGRIVVEGNTATIDRGEAWDHVCPVCRAQGLRSTIPTKPGEYTCTSAECERAHYDEDGKYVEGVPCNTCTAKLTCSLGHTIVLSRPAE